jgi:TolB protein
MKSKIARNLLKMNAMSRISRRIFLALALCVTALAQAQLSIEITGAGANRIPVTIVDFPGDPTAARVITATVRADLERSGLFKLVDNGTAAFDENAPVNHAEWKGKGADG